MPPHWVHLNLSLASSQKRAKFLVPSKNMIRPPTVATITILFTIVTFVKVEVQPPKGSSPSNASGCTPAVTTNGERPVSAGRFSGRVVYYWVGAPGSGCPVASFNTTNDDTEQYPLRLRT